MPTIPAELKNPFHTHKADDTVTIPAGDVPELHAEVKTKFREALVSTRETGHSVGLLVTGEAGSGKSHLLAQLRHQLAADPLAAFAVVRLRGAHAGRLWRHLREKLVEELFRQYPGPGHPGANGFLRILRNRFPKWAAAQSGGVLDWLLGRSKAEYLSGESRH